MTICLLAFLQSFWRISFCLLFFIYFNQLECFKSHYLVPNFNVTWDKTWTEMERKMWWSNTGKQNLSYHNVEHSKWINGEREMLNCIPIWFILHGTGNHVSFWTGKHIFSLFRIVWTLGFLFFKWLMTTYFWKLEVSLFLLSYPFLGNNISFLFIIKEW